MTIERDDAEPSMWGYWREKYGTAEALRAQYPNAAQEPQLAQALAQLDNALLVIDTIMAKKARDE